MTGLTQPVHRIHSSCRKLVAGTGAAGAGEWVCSLVWSAPNRGILREAYDISMATDGCYIATVEGSQLGGPTLKALDGSDVRNLLFTFEGCFDTT